MEPAEYGHMDAAEDAMWWYRALHLRLLGALEGVCGTVLDAGCGAGGFLKRLALDRPDLSAVGVDFFPPAAARAATKSGAPVACASVEALPFPDDAFDAVVSADVLCHRSVEPAAALAEMSRILRPGGRLVLNLPAYPWLMSAHDAHVHTARRSTAAGVRALMEGCGYTHVRTGYWNGLLLPLVILERKLLARGPDAASDVRSFPPWADATFFAVTEIERRMIGLAPAGSSVLATGSAP